MKKEKISTEELEKSLQYLEAFSKGKTSEPVDEKPTGENEEPKESLEEEPEDELYTAHKNRMAAYIDKAMCHKAYMDKIKKREPLPDEAFEDLEEPSNGGETREEKVEKGNQNELSEKNIDELVKAQISEALNAQKQESDAIIKSLRDEIEQLKDQPVRKTLIKGADAITLKKAISGEKVDDKTLLSISIQKSKVSEALFNAYENETDEVIKGQLGEAVAEFESTGNYISPEVAQIMETKGFRFIK